MKTLQTNISTSFQEAETVWRRYEGLHEHYIYQTFDWLACWFERIGRHRGLTPCLVDVQDKSGTPLAFLPLAIEKRLFGSALIWLGGDVSDYHGPLLTPAGARMLDDRALETLWTLIRKRIPGLDYVDFQRQPLVIGDFANPFYTMGRCARSEGALSTELIGDWPTYYGGKRSKKTRHNDRRKRRRLESMGDLVFVVASTPEEIEAQVEAMLAQKDGYVARLGQLNSLRQRGHDDFLKAMASDPALRDNTLLCALKLDGEILAVQWGVRHRRRFYSIIASYDDGPLSRYSTGDILLRELLVWCFQNDIDVLDFTRGDEPYKHAWCDRTLPLDDRLLPLSLLGHGIVNFRLLLTMLKGWARSSEALRGTVAAIRSRTRSYILHRRSQPAATAGRHAGSGEI